MQGFKKLGSALRYLLVAAASLLMAFPFYWMVTSALKSNDEIWQFPPTLWPQSPKWGQFAEAWVAAPFERYMVNSIFVAISIVVLQIINSGMMAYALTHMKFRLKGFFTAVVLVGYMVPSTAVYLPGYILLGKLGMLDSYAGLIFSNCVSVFSIFLIRQAFLQVSHEMVEAGQIDGASHFRILWTILLPLARSSFAVLGLITFIDQYNNYFWPMLITKNRRFAPGFGRAAQLFCGGGCLRAEMAADYGRQRFHDRSFARVVCADPENDHAKRQFVRRCK
ncbi:carbohydrate ABC transporter permease [Paenibacillus macerans]|uniref:carbohydrate ABC transporter permease n=1 Tax=Paenibacillus macerans TaxID=44252 RepID=UPI0037CC2AEB